VGFWKKIQQREKVFHEPVLEWVSKDFAQNTSWKDEPISFFVYKKTMRFITLSETEVNERL
jgi:hypothetical protein